MDAGSVVATVLTENAALDGLACEHGLSVHLQLSWGTVLFDTGDSDIFWSNARELGVDLSDARAVFLSHGHHDHAGGLPDFCDQIADAPVLLQASALRAKYSKSGEELSYAGVPRELAGACGERLQFVKDGDIPFPGVHVLGSREERYPLPSGNERLFVEIDEEVVRDPFDDELSVVLESGEKLMLITGCSHRGIANIVDACTRRFPHSALEVVVGGFHTKNDPPEVLDCVAERLSQILHIYAGHCTGEDAFEYLRRRIGPAVKPCPAGTRITFPA